MTIARLARGGAWHEFSVPVQDLGYTVRQLAGEQDVYLTQNRFFGRRRLVTRIAELDALFVDLDFHRTAHAGATPHVLDLASRYSRTHVSPAPARRVDRPRAGPGLAASAGAARGLAPLACLPAGAVRHPEPLGADRLARDAARVLRLIGTRNSRSGTLVEATDRRSGEAWDFDLLADEILPLPRAELVALRLEHATTASSRAGDPEPLRPVLHSAGLWELRLAELQRLLRASLARHPAGRTAGSPGC